MLQEGGARNEQATLTSYQLDQRKQSQPDCLTSGTTNDSSIRIYFRKGWEYYTFLCGKRACERS